MRRQNELKNYVSHLFEEGRRTHTDLRDAELEKITALLMKSRNVSGQWEFITESLNADELPRALIKYLESGDLDDAFHTLMQLKQGAKIYAWAKIDKLLEEETETAEQQEREALRQYRGRAKLSQEDLCTIHCFVKNPNVYSQNQRY